MSASRIVADCASDPPLSATERTLAVVRADDVLVGLGAVAEPAGKRAYAAIVRHTDAAKRVRARVRALELHVEVNRVKDAWPPAVPDATVERASTLVELADRLRRAPTVRYVTVAGAVREPLVLAAPPRTSMRALVERAGGAPPDWVAIAGGLPAGDIVPRDAIVDDLAGARLVLVLSSRHPMIRRLRTPLDAWLRRAASACVGCRACSDACPPARDRDLRPHDLIATLATLRDDGLDAASALACTGCGLCDAVCPQTLSPRAITVGVRETLRAAGAHLPPARRHRRAAAEGLDVPLLTQRLGLADFEPPAIQLATM